MWVRSGAAPPALRAPPPPASFPGSVLPGEPFPRKEKRTNEGEKEKRGRGGKWPQIVAPVTVPGEGGGGFTAGGGRAAEGAALGGVLCRTSPFTAAFLVLNSLFYGGG